MPNFSLIIRSHFLVTMLTQNVKVANWSRVSHALYLIYFNISYNKLAINEKNNLAPFAIDCVASIYFFKLLFQNFMTLLE